MEKQEDSVTQGDCTDHGKTGMATGYASVKLPVAAGLGRRNVLAHRLAYCTAHGVGIDSIAGKVVRHKCDNPRCINPEHLELGTHKDNTADALKRGRFVVGSAHVGSKLTEKQATEIIAASGTYSSIAATYGVGRNTVARIKSGEDWKHIPRR